MKKPKQVHARLPLHETLNHRLNVYALAASAAGMGLLAAVQPAEAEVVYTPAHVALRAGSFYVLDLNHDGVPDFRFGNVGRSTFGVFYVEPWGTNASFNAEECTNVPVYPLALNRGAPIGPGKSFYGTLGGPIYNQILAGGGDGDFGNWVNMSNRYLGLRFLINGENHYGWARLTVRVNGAAVTALLTGYAYESVGNRGLRAGQTLGSADTAARLRPEVPGGEPKNASWVQAESSKSESLGRLALGASRGQSYQTAAPRYGSE
ncbi:MAG: hypothetical protein WB562_02290 [Candidatus Sulfotelmatobacter sp.]